MEFIIKKHIDCSKIKNSECSDLIVEKLISAGLKLRADKIDHIVNGHLIIDHNLGLFKQHTIYVTIYEKNEKAGHQHHTTFKKPSKFPTLKEIKKLIDN